MDPKICIDLHDVEALADALERALEPREEGECASAVSGAWTDGFRASGVKHAMV